jgi:hypothetical protein
MTGLAVVLRAGVWVGDMLLHGEARRWDGRDEESEFGSKLPVCRLTGHECAESATKRPCSRYHSGPDW